ncbi:FAD-dependent oxidoreductase [Streptomyces sp. 8L]|uniref:FAD-dependent oxidoreductase n=1 Tax=Streptomyces sp. 8L TaxID=2877242 RepID=UPI001CD50C76|nr:FAD-dependent oxidoreductase [Streptomyces sp. 8L]MCA1222546.1 FAD-dependent oxidoreductase [Streptomyces sp. 8L]
MAGSARCVVVGGGPAGMVLGLLLARAGVEVTVLEKHADFLRDFRGDTVHPSTLTLLDELGLGGWFAALPHSRLDRVALAGEDGRTMTVADLSRLKVPHPYIAMAPQWDLLDLLADAGAREPSFDLRMRHEVTGLLREGGRVSGVGYRTADGAEGTLRAGLVVAADGRWSAVRRSAGLRPVSFPITFDAWWFRLPRHPHESGDGLVPRMAPGRFAVVIPRIGYYQIALLAPKGEDLRRLGVEGLRRNVARVCPELADRVDHLASTDDVSFLDVRMDRLRRWHTEGLLCVGDAAHAMSPVGGIGINLAVQDSVAAAALLARPLLRGGVTASELAAVRARRLAPVMAAQSMQRALHRAVIGPVMQGRRGAPPRALTGLLDRVPALTAAPAHVLGVGIRPEHAPAFARRAPLPPRAATGRRSG